MTHILRYYQEHQIHEDSRLIASTKRAIINQLPTGGGKAVEIATIAHRFSIKSGKRTLILVHREELLNQITATIADWYGTSCQAITAETKYVLDRSIYVGMVETIFNRLSANEGFLPEIGMLILDECHLGNFNKLHQFFQKSLIIGFTATPISADKRHPLKDFYEDIVTGPSIKELIAIGSLCQNVTYSIKGIDRSKLKVTLGDFNSKQMANEFGQVRHVENAIMKYEQHAPGTKAIIYNCSKEHNKIVCNAFKAKGYDCRFVDDNSNDRAEIFKWFEVTPHSILCNVGIATMGYDNPSVQTIITNFSTMSLTKWIQCGGRGSRPHETKQYFTIIDMGGNALFHGDWSDDRDWKEIFINPPTKSNKLDAAPYKNCDNCEALIVMRTKECPYCGYIFPSPNYDYDTKLVELTIITKGIDVKGLLEMNSRFNEWYTLFNIENNITTQIKYKIGSDRFTDQVAADALELFQDKAKVWCELTNKDWKYIKKFSQKHLYEKFKLMFGWYPNKPQYIANLEPLDSI